MNSWLIEFSVDDSGVSDFITVKADDEKKAVEAFNARKPAGWNFLSVKQVWFQE